MNTSYYQNKRLDPAKHLVVQISVGFPRFGAKPELQWEDLFPPVKALQVYQRTLSFPKFCEAYWKALEKVGVDTIRTTLREAEATAAASGRIPVLCCFEALKKPGQNCHRRAFAFWWEKQTGEKITEL